MPLTVTIPARELFNDETGEFSYTKEQRLTLEHSLVSVSKWESRHQESFLSKTKDKSLSPEELLDYIKCMTLTQNVDPEVYNYLPPKVLDEITDYIGNPMTATTFFGDDKNQHSTKKTTSEEIYYWMFSLGIPIDCQKWHLNRLLTLIRIFNIKNSPDKKMSKQQTMSENARLNALRRAASKSKG